MDRPEVVQIRPGAVARSVSPGDDDTDVGIRPDRFKGVEDLAGEGLAEGVAFRGAG